jgi:hypothetical protein
LLDYLLLAGSGFIAWIVSTIGGGGGALLLVPLVGFIAGGQAVAPVTTLATLIAGGGRAYVFWKDIDWSVFKWGLPGAMLGGVLGAALFSNAPAEWLQIVAGLYLFSTIFQYRVGRKERTFEVARWWFFPAELVVGFLDGLVGAVGPVMNTLYLNAGVTKERMRYQDGRFTTDASSEDRHLHNTRRNDGAALAPRDCSRSRRVGIQLAGKAVAKRHAGSEIPVYRRGLHGVERTCDDLAAT